MPRSHDAQHRQRRRAVVRGLAGVLLFATTGLPVKAFANSSAYPPIFGTREVRSTNLAPFPKWTGLLKRYFSENQVTGGVCDAKKFNSCHLRQWEAFLDTISGTDPMRQLDQINRFMNRAPYITDPRNYKMADYWATPRQFFNRDGDCEDYAIAKYMSLRALGWDNDHMRIVVLQDLNLRIAHAVLVVYRDGIAWVLDNQIKQVVAAGRIRHYRPYYSLNEESWWLHKP